jgi:tRNA(fMet)-specific endonuclease VapC
VTYALDTNVIFQLLRKNADIEKRFRQAKDMGCSFAIPPFVYYEVQRGFWLNAAPEKERMFEHICEAYEIGKMTLDVWDNAAQIYAALRRRNQTIEDADILIAAFCVVNSYILVTHNTRHFERVEELAIEDWASTVSS